MSIERHRNYNISREKISLFQMKDNDFLRFLDELINNFFMITPCTEDIRINILLDNKVSSLSYEYDETVKSKNHCDKNKLMDNISNDLLNIMNIKTLSIERIRVHCLYFTFDMQRVSKSKEKYIKHNIYLMNKNQVAHGNSHFDYNAWKEHIGIRVTIFNNFFDKSIKPYQKSLFFMFIPNKLLGNIIISQNKDLKYV